LRIESKRFVEEETQRKRLGSLRNESAGRTCHFLAAQPRWVALLQMNERYLRWYSPWLSREFEMLAFGNGGGLPLIIFPTSFGRNRSGKLLQQTNPSGRPYAHS
jgi:hypothetical protein